MNFSNFPNNLMKLLFLITDVEMMIHCHINSDIEFIHVPKIKCEFLKK